MVTLGWISAALGGRKSRPWAFLFGLFLLMSVPVYAEDLVFPQAQFLNLSSAEKRSYARLDFTAKVQLTHTALLLLPDRIVPAGAPAWEVPRPPVKLRWNSMAPSIYVPPGDYTLVFTGSRMAPTGLMNFGCLNQSISMGNNLICASNCTSHAVMDPEVSIPWKAIAGERYEIQAEQTVRAPLPIVQWAPFNVCRYNVAPAAGYGVADIRLINSSARHGTDAIPIVRSVRFTVTADSLKGATNAGSSPAAQVLQPPAAEEPAELTVTSTPAGASIRVNDNFFGKTPTKLKLVAGDYAISIELPGFTTWKRTLKLVSGSAISVDAQLAPSSSQPPESPPALPPSAHPAPPS
jgi:hypothetical protein